MPKEGYNSMASSRPLSASSASRPPSNRAPQRCDDPNVHDATGSVGDSGVGLRGADLVERIAQSSKIQKQRWVEIYTKLWEQNAKVDIADAIVIHGGTPRAWYFTSSTTGEILKKHDEKLNAIAIKKHFVRKSDSALLSRCIAVLLHEDRDGSIRYSTLSDLEFNAALCQSSSQLWTSSFLLQLFTPSSRQHPLYQGTFVAKFNATASCIRVLQMEESSYYYGMAQATKNANTTAVAACEMSTRESHKTKDHRDGAQVRSRPRSALASAGVRPSTEATWRVRPPHSESSHHHHHLEEIIKAELRKVVREVEVAFRDKLRLLYGEFQVTSTNRLVLVRVSHVVFFSDLTKRGSANAKSGVRTDGKPAKKTQRPSSATYPGAKICTGSHFCHCKIFASAAALKVPLSSTHEFQRITRKSLNLSEEESRYLEHFGAHAEAKLAVSAMSMRSHSHSQDAFTKLLQRRIFMLQSTIWNPKSDAFKVKPLEFHDSKKLPQQYEMVQVCRTCYLIYHTIDGERFQASRSTSKAVARLYNAKAQSTLASHVAIAAAVCGPGSSRSPRRPARQVKTRAWEEEEINVQVSPGELRSRSPAKQTTACSPGSVASRLAMVTID